MPTLEEVKARIEEFRTELIGKTKLEPDTQHSLKEILIHGGHGNMVRHHIELTLAELLDDMLLATDNSAADSTQESAKP